MKEPQRSEVRAFKQTLIETMIELMRRDPHGFLVISDAFRIAARVVAAEEKPRALRVV